MEGSRRGARSPTCRSRAPITGGPIPRRPSSHRRESTRNRALCSTISADAGSTCCGSAWARRASSARWIGRSEEHTSELQSRGHLVCRLLLEKKKKNIRRREVKCKNKRTGRRTSKHIKKK